MKTKIAGGKKIFTAKALHIACQLAHPALAASTRKCRVQALAGLKASKTFGPSWLGGSKILVPACPG